MKLNKKQFNLWLSYLYAEEYKQGHLRLQNNDGYCCLGVGCDLLIPIKKQSIDGCKQLVGDVPIHQSNAPEWLKLINGDFRSRTTHFLSTLNDQGTDDLGSFSHPEIAMLLQLVYIHKILD